MHGFGVAMINAMSRLKSADIKKANQKIKKQERDRKERDRAEKEDGFSKSEQKLLKRTRNLSRIEESRPSELQCPECHDFLFALQVDDFPFDACNKCRSVWFSMGQLKRFENAEKEFLTSGLRCRQSKYRCPKCDELMSECVYRIPNNLLIDVCPQGCGVYFEQGEFPRAIHIHHKDDVLKNE